MKMQGNELWYHKYYTWLKMVDISMQGANASLGKTWLTEAKLIIIRMEKCSTYLRKILGIAAGTYRQNEKLEHQSFQSAMWIFISIGSPLLFSPLKTPANIMISLPLQLMKATALAESSYFHLAISAVVMSTDESQVGVWLFPSF